MTNICAAFKHKKRQKKKKKVKTLKEKIVVTDTYSTHTFYFQL